MFADENSPTQLRNGIKTVKYSHDAMIDLIIQMPWVRQREIAVHFGISEPWISQVFRSDSFKKRLEDRKAELVDPLIVQSIQEGFETLIQQSQRVLQDRLTEAGPAADSKLALAILSVSAKALGFGARESTVNVNQNNNWFQQIVAQSGGHAELVKPKPAIEGSVTPDAQPKPQPASPPVQQPPPPPATTRIIPQNPQPKLAAAPMIRTFGLR
jgi:hypothetical protein